MHFWVDELRSSDKVIIVEGKKDEVSLKKLGITNIITINRPIFQLVEEISNKHNGVIILTDLDKQGKKLYSVLKHHLQKRGIKVDNKFREFLYRNTKLSNIEGINTYLKNIENPFL